MWTVRTVLEQKLAPRVFFHTIHVKAAVGFSVFKVSEVLDSAQKNSEITYSALEVFWNYWFSPEVSNSNQNFQQFQIQFRTFKDF